MSGVTFAVKNILNERRYLLVFILVWSGLFAGMFYLPVLEIPGNDAAFQAKLFTSWDYFILTAFSALSALVLTMQIKILVTTRRTHHIGQAGLSAVSGFVATLFATSTCTLCVGAFISFLGAGTVFMLVQNRIWLVLASLALLFLSMHLSAKRLVEGCERCKAGPLPMQ